MIRKMLLTAISIALLGSAALAHADDDDDRYRDRGRHGYWTDDDKRWNNRHARYDNRMLDRIVADATRRYPGRVVDVERDDGEYEIEIRQRNRREVKLDYSARTGRLLDVDFDN